MKATYAPEPGIYIDKNVTLDSASDATSNATMREDRNCPEILTTLNTAAKSNA